MIYVISDGEHYKIGYTAGEPRERLKTLQTGNPRRLSLVGTFFGDRAVEAALHARFSTIRVVGEWFALTVADFDWFTANLLTPEEAALDCAVEKHELSDVYGPNLSADDAEFCVWWYAGPRWPTWLAAARAGMPLKSLRAHVGMTPGDRIWGEHQLPLIPPLGVRLYELSLRRLKQIVDYLVLSESKG